MKVVPWKTSRRSPRRRNAPSLPGPARRPQARRSRKSRRRKSPSRRVTRPAPRLRRRPSPRARQGAPSPARRRSPPPGRARPSSMGSSPCWSPCSARGGQAGGITTRSIPTCRNCRARPSCGPSSATRRWSSAPWTARCWPFAARVMAASCAWPTCPRMCPRPSSPPRTSAFTNMTAPTRRRLSARPG